eukprot:4006159-Pyramimonas_sp.AAC.1
MPPVPIAAREARVHSHEGPIRRRKRVHIFTMDSHDGARTTPHVLPSPPISCCGFCGEQRAACVSMAVTYSTRVRQPISG